MPEIEQLLTTAMRDAVESARLSSAADVRRRAAHRHRRRVGAAVCGVVTACAAAIGVASLWPMSSTDSVTTPSPPAVSTTAGPALPRQGGGVQLSDTSLSPSRAYELVPVIGGRSRDDFSLTAGDDAIALSGARTRSHFLVASPPLRHPLWMVRLDELQGNRCLALTGNALTLRSCVLSDSAVQWHLYPAGKDDKGRDAYVIAAGIDLYGNGQLRYLAWDPQNGGRATVMPAADYPNASVAWTFADRGAPLSPN
ncbi:hypothetical protein AB0J80_09965 [Actinoplanes sp. NPDC049548]|uniref:hypothetical protein n=1 Tax=Actinoplanes sp. NPDC049548 TaxID=3155152 RepID=UPI003419307F